MKKITNPNCIASKRVGRRKTFPALQRVGLFLVILVGVFGQANMQVFAETFTCPDGMSQLDCDALQSGSDGGWTGWIPDNGSSDSCGASSDALTTTSGGLGKFTIDQVKTFASEPVTSTWNISDSTAEHWFLKQFGARATIAKYHLSSSNIGNITSAVKAANVSPEFFYLYTVNEGGGAGGFINHYGSDVAGGATANAMRDAQYLASESKQTSGHPASGGGEPSDMPTAEAQKILSALPAGSIGVVYIQATAAVTAELEDLSGKTGTWSGKFNKPLSDSMQNIKTMGGDPAQGGTTISTADCTNTSTPGGTASGNDDGYSASCTQYLTGGASVYCPGRSYGGQCTAFVNYELAKHGVINKGQLVSGNGGAIVGNLTKPPFNFAENTTPAVHAVMSTSDTSHPSVGHTAVVLQVNSDGSFIIGQYNVIPLKYSETTYTPTGTPGLYTASGGGWASGKKQHLTFAHTETKWQ